MKDIFNIYLTFGTVPSLYSQINMFLDKTPSYVFVRSSGNFDSKAVKNLKHVKKYYQLPLYDDVIYFEEEYKKVKDCIIESKKTNPKAKFKVYIDDSRAQFYLKPFLDAGAMDDIEKIVLLSEGNASKFLFYNLSNDDEKKSLEKWNYLIENYKNTEIIKKIDNYPYWLSTQKNAQYLLPYHKLFINNNIPKEYREKMHLADFPIEKMFNSLSIEQKKYFFDFDSLNIDKKQKYLIIIGTLDFGEKEITTAIIENLVDQILEDYKGYKLMYKSHPLASVEDNPSLLDYMQKHQIEIIPNKIPLEIVLWEYKNIDIGGFSSSIVSLIDRERIKFVFGQNLGYSEIIFNKDNPLKCYNVLVSQNIAYRLLINRNNMEKKLDDKLSTVGKDYINQKNEIEELRRIVEETKNETRISRFFYRFLRKIYHFFIRK